MPRKPAKVSLRCTHCQWVFRIVDPGASFLCTHCHTRFDCTPLDPASIRSDLARQAVERRKGTSTRWLRYPIQRAGHSVIRGEQIPVSLAEAQFKRRAFARGWKPHRPSWPDFLVETDFGLIAVEVKDKDEISREQHATFALLEEAGIAVHLWRRGDDSIRRWKPPIPAGDQELYLPQSHGVRTRGNPREDPKGVGDSPSARRPRASSNGAQHLERTAAGAPSAVREES